jgi:putative colanic acid biosynthesis acetyltransferase WcaF
LKILDARGNGTFAGGPTYSSKNRAFRGFWSLTWLLLAAWTPPPANRWRLFLLSLFGAKVAPKAFVYGSARIWYPPHFEVGQYARIWPSVTVYSVAKITLADYDIKDPHFRPRPGLS